jgi:DNA (cytosine-5)-methyltransferase 1
MKILNMYAGIGGNRKLWGNEHDVTAVEYKQSIADIYKDFFPNDTVIVADAHEYLQEHFKEYDFIWSSPPCPTHSRMRFKAYCNGKGKALFPDMKLYEEILFLQQYSICPYVVENVKSWYVPLIIPQYVGRHSFWANFNIPKIDVKSNDTGNNKGNTLQKKMLAKGFNIENWHGHKGDKRTLLNNCVVAELGLHILRCVI